MTSAKPLEARYIVRTILEELRIGVGEGSVRDAIVWSSFPRINGIFFKCDNCGKFMPKSKNCLECGSVLNTKFSNKVNNTKKSAKQISGVPEIQRISEHNSVKIKNISEISEVKVIYNFDNGTNQSITLNLAIEGFEGKIIIQDKSELLNYTIFIKDMFDNSYNTTEKTVILPEDKQPEKKEPSKTEDQNWLILGAAIIIIAIVVILLFFLIIKRKKNEEKEQKPQSAAETEKQIQQQLPQQPQQQPQIQPTVQSQPYQQIAQQQPHIQPTIQPQQKNCTTCGLSLIYYQQNNRYYCHHCKKYE